MSGFAAVPDALTYWTRRTLNDNVYVSIVSQMYLIPRFFKPSPSSKLLQILWSRQLFN